MARRPTQIGPYPLLGVLGEGGMGSVYLSKHPQLGCEVALKVMSAGRRATPAQRKRFEREVRTLRQLRHPGLVELLDAGEDKGVPWLAMRRVPGETLGDLFRSRAGFSAGEAVDLGVQVTSALVPAHALGILHRDLKPDNVIRTPEGRYVVTDFGLTKELDRDESVRLSQTGAVQGTPGYWAPEQASGTQGDWDARTDVYGVGALLYAALTGVPPIQGEGMVEIMIATENRVPVPPSELTREPVPAELDRIVLTCLEKSRGDRYESLELLRNDLLAFGEGTPPPTVRGGAWVPLALSGLLLLLLLPLGFFTARATDSAPSKAGSPLATSTASSPAADVQPSALYQRARRALAEQPPRAKEGVALLERAAEQGHLAAMAKLGQIVLRGELAPADPEASRLWFRRAAEGGNTQGMLGLARALEAGTGGAKNEVAARDWLTRAVETGSRPALGRLATLWLEGRGGPPDETRARALFRRGAEAGEIESMVGLANVLGRAQGGDADPVEAVRWYRESAKAGDPAGMEGLARALRYGRGVEKNLSEAVGWYRASSDAGRLSALRSLGTMHSTGQGTRKDPVAAFDCFRRAAEGGYMPAFQDLGVVYRLGQGTEVDLPAAVHWVQRGALAGDPVAMFTLGVLHESGEGVPRDLVEATLWYRRSSRKGYPAAMYNLGVILGRGSQAEVAEAATWFRRGAKSGHTRSASAFGEILSVGEGIAPDDAEARIWLLFAAKRGDVRAAYGLGRLLTRGRGGPKDEAKGLSWIKFAAEKGHAPAMGSYGLLLYGGHGVPKDATQAWKWIVRAAKGRDTHSMYLLGLRAIDKSDQAGSPAGKARAERGVGWLQAAARANSAPAMYNLGRLLQQGRWIPHDDAQAYAMFLRGLRQGDLDCLVAQGQALEIGQGVPRDLSAARRIFEQAARTGRPDAMGHLGRFLVAGHGGPTDVPTGVSWIRKAADAKDPAGMYALGYMLAKGQGVALDPVAALLWYRRAGAAGNLNAMHNLARILLKGNQEEKALGLEWLQRAAEAKLPASMLAWGRRLATGDGVPRDRVAAKVLLLAAAGSRISAVAERARVSLAELEAEPKAR